MNSKERVRAALQHQVPDRLPANLECVGTVMEKLQKHLGATEPELVYRHFEIDIRSVGPDYCGPALKTWTEAGVPYSIDHWGITTKQVWTGLEYHGITAHYPLDSLESAGQLDDYPWPNPDWFDYDSLKKQCDCHPDKALILGHEGPFQFACFLRSMENLFADMAGLPELAHGIFDRMVAFELEYYERCLTAAEGRIDILRPHDDYGTQISSLFSPQMWREYFAGNTRKLTDLAHRHGAFYQQHSCGAVRSIIPDLIACGVDSLEPIQKVAGMEPVGLKQDFGDKLCFHGGIDTQDLLPHGTATAVERETRHFIETFNQKGGYILMASQGFEGDVPLANIEAMYRVRD